MQLNKLYLIGALAVLAIPLSAGATPYQGNRQPAASALQETPTADACGHGWYWEQPGYAKHGKWRPAHCAPRETSY